jgi:hypothetical protein
MVYANLRASYAESIENNHLALQQFFAPYDPEDNWNGVKQVSSGRWNLLKY